jgi:proteasome lid subunit RPN8/RPN11
MAVSARQPPHHARPVTPGSDVAPVAVKAVVLREVEEHARRALPDECCGLLIGSNSEIVEAYAARNLRQSPTGYLVDPADHFAAIRRARTGGRAVIGAYHSHPASPPSPSATDHRKAAGEGFLYLIVSATTGDRGLYRVVGNQLAAQPMRVV